MVRVNVRVRVRVKVRVRVRGVSTKTIHLGWLRVGLA